VIEIRTCAPADAIAVSGLLDELGYKVSTRQAAEHIRQLTETGADPIFLAVADTDVLGLVASHICRMLQYEKPLLRVTALVVDGRARRRGVGKLLMQHAERFAAAAGCEAVELTSAVGRLEAHAFYRGIGYEANSLRFRKALAGPASG
jgi:GNAT superfamily N-acetyltransferase